MQLEEKLEEKCSALKDLVAKRAATLEQINMKLRKKNAELENKDNELNIERNKFKKYLDTAKSIILVLDLKGKVILINQRGSEVLGWDSEKIIGTNWFDSFVPKHNKHNAKKIFEEIISRKNKIIKFEHFESPIINKNGEERIISWHNNIIKNEKNEIINLISSGEDITEKKRTEKEILESQKSFKELFNMSPASLWEEDFSLVKKYIKGKSINNLSKYFDDNPQELIKCANLIKIKDVNEATLKLYKAKSRKEFKKNLTSFFTKESFVAFKKELIALMQGKEEFFCQTVNKRLDGEEIIINLRYAVPYNYRKDLSKVIISIVDVTSEKKVEDKLRRKLEFEKLILDLSNRFITLKLRDFDKEIQEALRDIGRFVDVDRSYIFKFSDDDTKMSNLYEWCDKGIKSYKDNLQNLNTADFSWFINKIKNENIVKIIDIADLAKEASIEKKIFKRQNIRSLVNVPLVFEKKIVGFLGFDSVKKTKIWNEEDVKLLDIASNLFSNIMIRRKTQFDLEIANKELSSANKLLNQLSLKDLHTGLYNHRYLKEAIESEYNRAKRYNLPLSVLMIDIDYFKSINDAYGHQFGDLILRQVAEKLRNIVRKYDIIIRFGGEEFTIISPGVKEAEALTLGRRISDEVSLEDFGTGDKIIKLSLSIAIASFPQHRIKQGMELVDITDKILREVKEQGGNKVFSYSDFISQRNPSAKPKDENDIKLLKNQVSKLTKQSNQNLIEAVTALAHTIKLKDYYTGKHVENTVRYAIDIANALKLSSRELEYIRQAAVLHDLGKVGIREDVLLKPGKLTIEEFEEIKKHPQIGVDIIRPIHFLHDVMPLILYHHERFDGKGYPYGLQGEEIPIGARIVAIADVFQALTSDRPYREAFTKERAIKIIEDNAGTQFDPKVVNLFLKAINS